MSNLSMRIPSVTVKASRVPANVLAKARMALAKLARALVRPALPPPPVAHKPNEARDGAGSGRSVVIGAI